MIQLRKQQPYIYAHAHTCFDGKVKKCIQNTGRKSSWKAENNELRKIGCMDGSDSVMNI
jgi:hypothetical protein